MTDKQLEKLGFSRVSVLRKHRRKFWHNDLEIEMHIPADWSISQIMQAIYSRGYEEGTESGKRAKIDEIKKVLEIYE